MQNAQRRENTAAQAVAPRNRLARHRLTLVGLVTKQ